jgi:tetratricopeptide (TPR) repeat protein
MKQKYFLLVFLYTTQFLLAQKNTFKIPDSLKNKNFEYLDKKISESKTDSVKSALYRNTFLYKAKKEQNWTEIVNGYKNILHRSPDNLKLIYADSMIYAAKKTKQDDLIGSAYLTKGIVYYEKKQLQNALDNYTTAHNYISKTNDHYLIYKTKYNIALIKMHLGYYDEAISLLKECVLSFKQNNNTRPYLNSLHSLGLCYNRIGNYGLCTQTNNLGLAESIRLKNEEINHYFIHSEGINQYFLKNYPVAIKKLQSSLSPITEHNDFANEATANFYIGKSFWDLEKYEVALPYFLRVDQIFTDKGYIRPDIRQVYELL